MKSKVTTLRLFSLLLFLFLCTDNIKINKMREPLANSRQLAWAWWADERWSWLLLATSAVRVRSHGLSCAKNCWFRCILTLQLWSFPTSDYTFEQTQAQAQPFKARITFELNKINLLQPSGYFKYRQFNIQQFYVLPTQCICVFCVDLRTNSDYFPIQH